MPRPYDFAVFANDVYNPVSGSLPDGWRSYIDSDQVGLIGGDNYFGKVYVNDALKQYVVAHRGTVLSRVAANLWEDLDIALGNELSAFQRNALPFVRYIIANMSSTDYSFAGITGHSLGAAYSVLSWNALKSGGVSIPTTVFELPMPSINSPLSTEIQIYNAAPNVVNSMNNPGTDVTRIYTTLPPRTPPTNIEIPPGILDFFSFTINQHSMISILNIFDSATGEARISSVYPSSTWPGLISYNPIANFHISYNSFISYAQNPYYLNNIIKGYWESIGLSENAYYCRGFFVVMSLQDCKNQIIKAALSPTTSNVGTGVKVTGDDSGHDFWGGTEYNDTYLGGAGNDIYWLFGGDDTVIDTGGANSYYFVSPQSGRKSLFDANPKLARAFNDSSPIEGKAIPITKYAPPISGRSLTEGHGHLRGSLESHGQKLQSEASVYALFDPIYGRAFIAQNAADGSLRISDSLSHITTGEGLAIQNFTSGDFGIVINDQSKIFFSNILTYNYGVFGSFAFDSNSNIILNGLFLINGSSEIVINNAWLISSNGNAEQIPFDDISTTSTTSTESGILVNLFQDPNSYQQFIQIINNHNIVLCQYTPAPNIHYFDGWDNRPFIAKDYSPTAIMFFGYNTTFNFFDNNNYIVTILDHNCNFINNYPFPVKNNLNIDYDRYFGLVSKSNTGFIFYCRGEGTLKFIITDNVLTPLSNWITVVNSTGTDSRPLFSGSLIDPVDQTINIFYKLFPGYTEDCSMPVYFSKGYTEHIARYSATGSKIFDNLIESVDYTNPCPGSSNYQQNLFATQYLPKFWSSDYNSFIGFTIADNEIRLKQMNFLGNVLQDILMTSFPTDGFNYAAQGLMLPNGKVGFVYVTADDQGTIAKILFVDPANPGPTNDIILGGAAASDIDCSTSTALKCYAIAQSDAQDILTARKGQNAVLIGSPGSDIFKFLPASYARRLSADEENESSRDVRNLQTSGINDNSTQLWSFDAEDSLDLSAIDWQNAVITTNNDTSWLSLPGVAPIQIIHAQGSIPFNLTMSPGGMVTPVSPYLPVPTPSNTPISPSEASHATGDLGGGAIAGIVISIIALIGVGVGIFIFYDKIKNWWHSDKVAVGGCSSNSDNSKEIVSAVNPLNNIELTVVPNHEEDTHEIGGAMAMPMEKFE